MANFLDKLLSGARQYTRIDFTIFKLALLCIGVLLGTYFSAFFLQYITALWLLAILFCATILYITLSKGFDSKKE